MPETTLNQLIEWIWIPMAGAIVALWRKINGAETGVKLIQQHDKTELYRRSEERDMYESQRKEVMDLIQHNHDMVMEKLERLEVRIKNGH
jgi:hypothetical protein